MARFVFAAAVTGAIFGLSAGGAVAAETCNGPDIAATAFSVAEVTAGANGTWNFDIVCSFENSGSADFVSDRHKQALHIYQKPAGEDPMRLRYRPFADMEKGETLKLTGKVENWDVANAATTTFECSVIYGPEVGADGDPANNDCNRDNDRLVMPGEEIARLITAIRVQ
ncbi:MAG: hypothetical protein C0606_09125 [Hyphomicrobiales bacterium]|nr:MAG: hypothetical protein C0606_09125 [Hyphomicrobiales bacterium]